MAKKRCRVVFVEIGKELKGKEKAINKDLVSLGISISGLHILKAKKNGSPTYVYTYKYGFDLNRKIKEKEFAKIHAVLKKHLGVRKKGGAR